MFDLPVLTPNQRKQATKFRKSLLDDGYFMVQYSVYTRACPNIERLQKHKARLEKFIPEDGNIRVLFLTDYQWQKSIAIMGTEYPQENRQLTLDMPRQAIFWE